MMAREREQIRLERDKLFCEYQENQKIHEEKMKVDFQSRLKANEESVHAFYLTQMESLLSDKVASLQNYINEWEKKLIGKPSTILICILAITRKGRFILNSAQHCLKTKCQIKVNDYFFYR